MAFVLDMDCRDCDEDDDDRLENVDATTWDEDVVMVLLWLW